MLYPGIIYHCDLSEPNPEPKVFREVEVKGIKHEDIETRQVISLFLVICLISVEHTVMLCILTVLLIFRVMMLLL